MAALERLDMSSTTRCTAFSSAISMQRTSSTSTSPHAQRLVGIVINTGEDNYLTTADAVDQAPAVLASQFINEEFAHRAGLPTRKSLGDAYEIDPDGRTASSISCASAARARIFPDAPLSTCRHQTHDGDIFKGHLIDAMFNLASV